MSDFRSRTTKETLKQCFGIEPRPPVGDHQTPRDPSDRRHMIAFVASVLFIMMLAVAVVQFDLYSFEFRDIPIEEQIPGREVITPTAGPTS